MTLYEYVNQNNRFELLLEWDRAANKGIDPGKVSPSSTESIVWICEEGHHWNASIKARAFRRTGCPFCTGQKAIPGETDLATVRPELARLWHPTLNGKLTPDRISSASHKKVWWKCEKGHDWQASVYSVRDGSGCPYCSGRRAVAGETDLATTHPELAAEWDTEKNDRAALEVTSGSCINAWWRCPEGHSYRSVVYARAAGTGCPYCAGKKVLVGFNDLKTTDPALCDSWDYEKNTIKPEEINRGSHKKVWWKCDKGHSYQSAAYTRISGSGCPYCAGRKVLRGFNDLATTDPRVAAQWDHELNGDLKPDMVTRGANKKAWWRCSEGHVWQAVIFSRTRKQASDCPFCAGRVKVRFNNRYKMEDVVKLNRTQVANAKAPSSVAV